MATAGGKKRLPSKVGVPRSNFDPPPIPLDVVPVRKPIGEDIVGWIAAVVLVALLLPMLGMLYIDILEAKHDAKVQMEKVEKLRRQIEAQQRKDKEK